jgi:hypothetical protein
VYMGGVFLAGWALWSAAGGKRVNLTVGDSFRLT